MNKFEKAKLAIQELRRDESVSTDETYECLLEIKEDIEEMLDSILDDEEEN